MIAAPAEPALVVAGAGAGKTETMAARVVWLVANGLVTPDRVLGLTFTRKAARQLADRVRARLRRLAGSGLLARHRPERRAAGRRVRGRADRADLPRLRRPAGRRARAAAAGRAGRAAAHRDRVLAARPPRGVDVDPGPGHRPGAGHRDPLPAGAGRRARRAPGRRGPARATTPRRRRRHRERAARAAPARRAVAEPARGRCHATVPARAAAARARLRRAQARARARWTSPSRWRWPRSSRARTRRSCTASGSATASRCSTSTRTPGTRNGSCCGRCSAVRTASRCRSPRSATRCRRSTAGAARAPRTCRGSRPTSRRRRRKPATRYGLLTSFRNPPEVLALANAISGAAARAGLDVDELRAPAGAGPARCPMCDCSRTPRRRSTGWPTTIAARWRASVAERAAPPTAAVLVRRRADMTDLAAALRERGLPVEVVGIGGLLDEPEVRDLVSALRVLIDPLAGTAAARRADRRAVAAGRGGPGGAVAAGGRARQGLRGGARATRPAGRHGAGGGRRAGRPGRRDRRSRARRRRTRRRATGGSARSAASCARCAAGSTSRCRSWWPRWSGRCCSTSRRRPGRAARGGRT